MKLIKYDNGTVVFQASGDDIVPLHGYLVRDLIDSVGVAYNFSIKPNIPPGMPPSVLPYLIFQSGALVKDSNKLPIIQLTILQNGFSISAATTDIADTVLDDFITLLDRDYKFRIATAKTRRIYQSNIVVQFDNDIADKIAPLQKIEKLLDREIKRPMVPFKVKRLAFGSGDVTTQQAYSIEAVENSDFVIERRVGEIYSDNRYFCSAPVTSSEHVRILEKIEKELAG